MKIGKIRKVFKALAAAFCLIMFGVMLTGLGLMFKEHETNQSLSIFGMIVFAIAAVGYVFLFKKAYNSFWSEDSSK